MQGVNFNIRVNTNGGAAEVSAVERAMQGAATATNTWQSRLNSIGNSAFQINNIGSAISNVTGKLQQVWGLVDKAMNFQGIKTSFEVLAGNAEIGRKLAADLDDIQQKTILGPEVFGAAQTMMGFGIATKDVTKDIKMMGDVAMGNADRFKSLSLVFAQTQAAGKLMGQDLLQYINAGFNPLTVMSEKWEQFGFTSKKSVGELKAMVEKGAISSDMVAKAFEVATSKGGKFANMMDTMADTSFGKMQQLEGQWEKFKISAGEALMPVAEDLMTVASKTMDWLGITKTAPDVLAGEQAAIGSLVGQISVLNEGNTFRHDLLNKLVRSYPDLFKGIDIEKVKNSELIEKLKEVNAQYKERISLATNELVADTQGKYAKESFGEYVRYQAIADAYRDGNTDLAKSMKKWDEGSLTEKAGQNKADYYQGLADKEKAKYEKYNTNANTAGEKAESERNSQTVTKALSLYASGKGMSDFFGNDKKRQQEFIGEISKINPFSEKGSLKSMLQGPDVKKLEDLMNAATDKLEPATNTTLTAEGKTKAKGPTKTARETASNITSTGQRAYYIDLKINTLVGEYTLHTSNFKEGSKASAAQVVGDLLGQLNGMNQALENS